jgi:hypothetical protein
MLDGAGGRSKLAGVQQRSGGKRPDQWSQRAERSECLHCGGDLEDSAPTLVGVEPQHSDIGDARPEPVGQGFVGGVQRTESRMLAEAGYRRLSATCSSSYDSFSPIGDSPLPTHLSISVH